MSDDLFKAALGAINNAYVPYSKHPVGAAIRTKNGKVFPGSNVETAHYICVHAEASAISNMVTAGERDIAEVAIVGPGQEMCTPCGDCRQRIREFSKDMSETVIKVYNRDGDLLKSYTLDVLLPDSFGPDNVNEMSK